MKIAVLALAAYQMVPVKSSGFRSLVGDESSSETAIATIKDEPDQGDERELLSPWCAKDTPSLWHPDYTRGWSVSGCVYKADCNQVGSATKPECCAQYFGGQTGGDCTPILAAASGTGGIKWYADYGTAWPKAGCKSETPYPMYASTFYDTQLACCKAAYSGQVSGACIDGLPNRPTMAPITAGGMGGKWYADYSTTWSVAGCKNTVPYPSHSTVFYGSQLACCKSAYSNQMSGACIKGLLSAPTMSPTKPPTNKPTSFPTMLPTSRPTSTPTVTPTITVGVLGTYSQPVSTGTRVLRQLSSVSSAFNEVFKEAIKVLILAQLSSSQTLENVNIISATITGQVLTVFFDVILKEVCSVSCTTQQITTQLDDLVKNKLTSASADGSFALALKNEYQDAASANSTAVSSDTLLPYLSSLNTTAGAATLNVTISVTVTTNSPTSQPTSGKPSTATPSKSPTASPSKDPSSNPSGRPSLNPSSNPSGRPSRNPSSNPSGNPSSNPSSNPSTSKNPSSNPSSDPSSSTNPSSNPSSGPSGSPSSNPSSNPSTSKNPSSNPSSNPSLSTNPSSNPSSNPSGQPSRNPSSNPSESREPSSDPSGVPSQNPSNSPTTQLKYVQHVSRIDEYANGQWYASKVGNGTANITCLGVNSTVGLYTSLQNNSDKADVGIYFYDRPVGLFNGMKFKDMVNAGITFEYEFFKEFVTGGNVNAAPAIKIGLNLPTLGKFASLVWEPYQGGCSSPGCVNIPPTGTWHSISVGNTTGTSSVGATNHQGWWKTGASPGMSSLGSLAAWATWFASSAGFGPTFMDAAVVVDVRIGVGSVNPGLTSYVNGLRIAANEYDWKWKFGVASSCTHN